jgi:hypothetical protein
VHCLQAVLCITTRSSSNTRSSSGSDSSNSSSAADTIKSNNIPRAAHEACLDLRLYPSLGFTPAQLRIDMQLVERSYLNNLYHNKHHGADVVAKSARTMKRDRDSLQRRIMEAQGLTLEQWSEEHERRFEVFMLAVILAAAMHDALHSGQCVCAATCHSVAARGLSVCSRVACFETALLLGSCSPVVNSRKACAGSTKCCPASSDSAGSCWFDPSATNMNLTTVGCLLLLLLQASITPT